MFTQAEADKHVAFKADSFETAKATRAARKDQKCWAVWSPMAKAVGCAAMRKHGMRD